MKNLKLNPTKLPYNPHVAITAREGAVLYNSDYDQGQISSLDFRSSIDYAKYDAYLPDIPHHAYVCIMSGKSLELRSITREEWRKMEHGIRAYYWGLDQEEKKHP